MNKKLQRQFFAYTNLLSEKPGSEEIISVLMEIEKLLVTSKQSYDSENDNLTNKSVAILLDDIIDKIDEILQKGNAFDTITRFGIVHKQLFQKSLTTDKKQKASSGNRDIPLEKKEIKHSHFNSIIQILQNNGIYSENIIIYSDEKSNFFIIIPHLSRSIAVCNSCGEKTFITQGSISPENFLKNITKKLVDNHGDYRAVEGGNIGGKIKELLFSEWTEEGVTQEKNPVGKKIDIQTLEPSLTYIYETFSPEKLMNMTKQNIAIIDKELKDKTSMSFCNIAKELNIKTRYQKYITTNFNASANRIHRACLLKEIFGHGIPKIEEIFHKLKLKEGAPQKPEQWKKYLENKGLTAKKLMNMSGDVFEQKSKEIEKDLGMNFPDIAAQLNIKEKYIKYIQNDLRVLDSKVHRACLLKEIFGDDIQEINMQLWDKEQWKGYFNDKGLSAEKLIEKNKKEIQLIEQENGVKFSLIATRLDIAKKYEKYIQQSFDFSDYKVHRACLLKEIFGDDIPEIEAILTNFRNKHPDLFSKKS